FSLGGAASRTGLKETASAAQTARRRTKTQRRSDIFFLLSSSWKALATGGPRSYPLDGILFALTGRHVEVRPLRSQAVCQLFQGETLRGVVARQAQGDALSASRQVIVEAHLAGEEHLGARTHGVGKQLAAGAAQDRHPFDRPRRVAD